MSEHRSPTAATSAVRFWPLEPQMVRYLTNMIEAPVSLCLTLGIRSNEPR